MKYCVHCGKQVLDDAIICPGCGCSVQYGNQGGNNNGNMYKGGAKNNNNAQQQQQAPQYADNYSGMSIAGMVLAFFSPLIGLILSIFAHNEAKRTGSGKSLSLSKVGIIISSVLLGIIAVVIIFYIIILIVAITGLGYMVF